MAQDAEVEDEGDPSFESEAATALGGERCAGSRRVQPPFATGTIDDHDSFVRPAKELVIVVPNNTTDKASPQIPRPPTWSVVFRAVWSWDLLGISIVYFVEGIMDMNLLAIQYFIKDTLGLGPAEAGVAQAAASLPWELTPLLGLLTDAVAIFGYHRKAYLLLVGIVGCCCWLLLPACTNVVMAVTVIGIANVCTAWSQVIADAVMVRMCQGREQDVASFYQGLSWSSYTGGALLSALVGGLLIDSRGPMVVFKLGALGLLLDALCALLISEQRQGQGPKAKGLSTAQYKGAVAQLAAAWASPRGSKHAGKGSNVGTPTKDGAGRVPSEAAEPLLRSVLRDRAVKNVLETGSITASMATSRQDSLLELLLEEQPQQLPEEAAVLTSYWTISGDLIKTVLQTICLPQIFAPALFIFLWQASPSPYNAMFYFQTNFLGFSAQFLELVQLCGYLSGFAGLTLYQLFLVNSPMRSMLLGCSIAGTVLNATQLILVTRLNVRLGIPDKVFVLGDYTMMSVLSEVMMTPLMAVAARMCPTGAEAVMYSSMYMILNWSNALATALGAGLTKLFGVTEDRFDGMPWLMLACNVCMVLPMPVLYFMPSGGEVAAPMAGAGMKRIVSSTSGSDGETGSTPDMIATALSVRRLVPLALTPVASLYQNATWDEDAEADGEDDALSEEQEEEEAYRRLS